MQRTASYRVNLCSLSCFFCLWSREVSAMATDIVQYKGCPCVVPEDPRCSHPFNVDIFKHPFRQGEGFFQPFCRSFHPCLHCFVL
ncbi:hypothetical protein F4861DRAFT_494661 [Xylaria intraflava]|nr:hypothetical protein F4861DRAFT_494661 [Xylaria intraflava]